MNKLSRTILSVYLKFRLLQISDITKDEEISLFDLQDLTLYRSIPNFNGPRDLHDLTPYRSIPNFNGPRDLHDTTIYRSIPNFNGPRDLHDITLPKYMYTEFQWPLRHNSNL